MNRKSRKGKSAGQYLEHVQAASRQSSQLGTLISTAANVAKSIPVIGSIVDTAETVASSILSFLGIGSSVFSVHYLANGRRIALPHKHVSYDEKAAIYYTPNETVAPGSILMRYQLSIGPQGSRSRRMGENFEKYILKSFQLYVTASCAATEPGQLAYLYVPDPSDRTLDSMENSTRLEAVLGRDNVQLAQIWQNTVLSFKPGNREYYVQNTGDERFSSPGAVYVLAVTSLDSAKLPTLRQTSSLEFRKAASAPTSYDTQVALCDVTNVHSDAGDDLKFALSESLHNFDATRITSVQPGNVPLPCMSVYQGETVMITFPTSISNEPGQTQASARPYFLPSGNLTASPLYLSLIADGTTCAPQPDFGYVARSAAAFLLEAKEDGYVLYEDFRNNSSETVPAPGWSENRCTIIIFPPGTFVSPSVGVSASVALSTHRYEKGVRCALPIARHLKPLPPIRTSDEPIVVARPPPCTPTPAATLSAAGPRPLQRK